MDALSVFVSSFNIFMFMATLIQNSLVFVLYRRKSKFIKEKRSLFPLCVVAADMMVAGSILTVIVSRFLYYQLHDWRPALFVVYSMAVIIEYMAVTVSQFSQLACVLEWLLSVRLPLRHHTVLSTFRRRVLCAAIWTVTGIMTMAHLVVVVDYNWGSRYTKWEHVVPTFTAVLVLAVLPGPISFIMFIYTTVLICQAIMKSHHLRAAGDQGDVTWVSRVQKYKTTILLLATMSLLTSFGYPAAVMLMLFNWTELVPIDPTASKIFDAALHIIGNPLLLATPWVYIINRKKLMKYLCTIKRSRRKKISTSEQSWKTGIDNDSYI